MKRLAVIFRNIDTGEFEGQGYFMPSEEVFIKYAEELGAVKIADNKYKHPRRNCYICLEEAIHIGGQKKMKKDIIMEQADVEQYLGTASKHALGIIMDEISSGRKKDGKPYETTIEQRIEDMKKIQDIQATNGNYNYSEYMYGLLNGMEMMISTMEGREPEFKEKPLNFLNEKKYGEQLEVVITNGYVAPDTIESFTSRGWHFVTTVPARLVHPHALPTDKATIFSKYLPYPKPVHSEEAVALGE